MMLRGLVLATTLCTASANVYEYKQQPLDPDVIQYRRVGMWAPADAPAVGRPGDGKATIEADVAFRRLEADYEGIIQLLVFHSKDLPMVGYLDPEIGQRTYCCTGPLKRENVPGCTKIGHMIVNDVGGGEIARWDITFHKNQSTASHNEKFEVTESGVHYLLFSSCDPQTGSVQITGHTIWRNPYGYLPGELYMFLPFYGAMSLVYLGLGLLWFLVCARYWQDLLRLQNCISGVIALGMIESATWYFDYVSFNSGGTRSVGPVVLAVLTSTVKKTLSRLLVLVVSLGYGVVRPTLGNVAYKVMLLGVVYFVFSALLDVVSNVSQISEITVPVRLLFILPVALLDACFYWWIFSGLSRTLSQLSSRRQSAKLLLYKRFSKVLLGSVIISALWVTYQMIVILSDEQDERWDLLWVFDAFWYVLYFGILVAIAILWSPSQNNMQYAYSDELAQEEDEEDDNDKDAPPGSFTIDDDGEEDEMEGKKE